MPELPEVETIRRALDPLVRGRRIVAVDAHPSDRFGPARDTLGARTGEVRRRGKYLLVDLDHDRELVVHLGMTGRLRAAARADDPYVRARWCFDDGSGIEYHDVRRFGRLAVVPRGDHSGIPTLHHLGPEPLGDGFEPERFWRDLRASRRRVKTRLLDQRAVAGVGNIYADEALWEAAVHPASRRVTRAQATRLHGALRAVLAAGIAHGGTTLRDYRTVAGGSGTHQDHLRCYGRAGRACPRCGAVLCRRVLDGRGTTWCPDCQRA